MLFEHIFFQHLSLPVVLESQQAWNKEIQGSDFLKSLTIVPLRVEITYQLLTQRPCKCVIVGDPHVGPILNNWGQVYTTASQCKTLFSKVLQCLDTTSVYAGIAELLIISQPAPPPADRLCNGAPHVQYALRKQYSVNINGVAGCRMWTDGKVRFGVWLWTAGLPNPGWIWEYGLGVFDCYLCVYVQSNFFSSCCHLYFSVSAHWLCFQMVALSLYRAQALS